MQQSVAGFQVGSHATGLGRLLWGGAALGSSRPGPCDPPPLQTQPEQFGGARAPTFVELPVDRGLHTEPATRPWPEAAAATRIKPFMERVKSILPESTAVAALEQAPEEWVPTDAGLIAPQPPPEPATGTSRLGEDKGGRLSACSDHPVLACPGHSSATGGISQFGNAVSLQRGKSSLTRQTQPASMPWLSATA